MVEEATLPLYGDVLECILSHVPTTDLLCARRVSPTWRAGAHSSSRLVPRLKPWLLLRLPRACAAYDPQSRTWVPLPPPRQHLRVRSSSPDLLFDLSLPSLRLLQPPSATWTCLPSPRAWRVDPVVSLVGPTAVVAGGTSEYEDESAASVEIFNPISRTWESRDPIPPDLPSSATWLSVAASPTKLHAIAKNTGLYSSFDPKTGTWSRAIDLRPDPTVQISAIAYTGTRLLYAGLGGTRLRVYEVGGGEIGMMPAEMAARLVGEGLGKITTIGFCAVGEFAYFYNPAHFKEGFFYDIREGRWESIGRPKAVDVDPLGRIAFGCATVTLDQLLKVFQQ